MKDAFDALMKRPSLTVVEADYQSMFEMIRTRLVAEVGISSWLPDVEPISGTACAGKLSNLDGGQERLYNAGSSSGNPRTPSGTRRSRSLPRWPNNTGSERRRWS